MTKNDFIQLGLTEELATKAAEASKKELEGYVEKSKLDLANSEKETLTAQVKEHTKQLDALKKTAGDNDALKKQIEELQDASKKAKGEYDSKIRQMRIDYAVDAALTTAKAKNIIATKALLKLDELEVDDDGKVKGIEKQLKKLTETEDTKFLFDQPADPSGGKPDSGVKGAENDTGGGSSGDNSGGGTQISIGEQMAKEYNAVHVPDTGANK